MRRNGVIRCPVARRNDNRNRETDAFLRTSVVLQLIHPISLLLTTMDFPNANDFGGFGAINGVLWALVIAGITYLWFGDWIIGTVIGMAIGLGRGRVMTADGEMGPALALAASAMSAQAKAVANHADTNTT